MKKIVIANWKMNPRTLAEAKKLYAATEHHIASAPNCQVIICAPFVYLPALSHLKHLSNLGAQNVNWAEEGAMTGEISVSMLKALRVGYVILGHSERRIYLGETDLAVREKIDACLRHGITPILCLGGDVDARKENMKALVTKQFANATKNLGADSLKKIIYVYEPSWAISSMPGSHPSDGDHARSLVEFVFELLKKRIGPAFRTCRVLYGGTVTRTTVAEYAKHQVIDGVLVGGASLDSENFWAVIKEFNKLTGSIS